MRDPSVHISQSVLEMILLEHDPELDINAIVKTIMNEGYKHRLSHRIIVKQNSRNVRKIIKSAENDSAIFDRVNFHLVAERQKNGHKHIQAIKLDSRGYNAVKTLASDIEEFIELFELDSETAIPWYISEGLRRIGKNYSTNKFSYHKDYIFQEFRSLLDMTNDENPKFTKEIYTYYLSKINVEIDMNVNFVYAADDIRHHKADYKVWIKAQFEELDFLGVVPEPTQLHGVNAEQRYLRFIKGKKVRRPASVDRAAEKARKILAKVKKNS